LTDASIAEHSAQAPGVDDPQATNQAGWFARTYQYSASIPHAVTSVNPETGTPDTYEYDENGNMICRVENGVTYTHTYNAENRASSIAKRTGDCATGTILESWSFAYDGDGVRVMTAHFTGTQGTPDSVTSYFMGGQYELKDGAIKKYYSIAGMMVATQDASGLQYLLTDHLGSTVAVTNASGTLTSQQRYLPFGAARTIPNSPILATDFGYTGQRMLDEDMGGIMDYKARFYSPALGRFLQPDTIIPDQSNPQSWNRFSYVVNNPIRYNDPSGHCAWDLCIVEGVTISTTVVVLLAVVAVVSVGMMVCNAIISCHDAMVDGISSAIDNASGMAKGWKEKGLGTLDGIRRIQSAMSQTAETLMPGSAGPMKPAGKCNFFCWLGIITGGAFFACASIFEERCVDAASNPDSRLTPVPADSTATPTMTPSPTSTSTPTQTVIPTNTATSTPTQTPVPPAITPVPPRRDERQLIPI
jgi:RHS repeat-associated protein